MSYTILIACVAAGWSFLRILGGAEATRLEAEKRLQAAAAAAEPAEEPAA